MRLAQGDDTGVDPKTGKNKLFEIVVRTPVHILSCYARAEYTALPRYTETIDESAMMKQHTPVCLCVERCKRRGREGADWLPADVNCASPLLLEEDGSDASENDDELLGPLYHGIPMCS